MTHLSFCFVILPIQLNDQRDSADLNQTTHSGPQKLHHYDIYGINVKCMDTLQQHRSVYSRSTVKLVLCTFERDGNLGCDRDPVVEQAKLNVFVSLKDFLNRDESSPMG